MREQRQNLVKLEISIIIMTAMGLPVNKFIEKYHTP